MNKENQTKAKGKVELTFSFINEDETHTSFNSGITLISLIIMIIILVILATVTIKGLMRK